MQLNQTPATNHQQSRRRREGCFNGRTTIRNGIYIFLQIFVYGLIFVLPVFSFQKCPSDTVACASPVQVFFYLIVPGIFALGLSFLLGSKINRIWGKVIVILLIQILWLLSIVFVLALFQSYLASCVKNCWY